MDVVVDTNVLVTDPWFEGQKMRALFNFLERTRSRMLVHDLVEQELRAVVARGWAEAAKGVVKAERQAKRVRLHVPPANLDSARAATEQAWEEAYQRTERFRTAIKLNNGLLPEVLRRATQRIPPCARKGEEFRDAVLWLGMIDYFGDGATDRVAFISGNTKDFCGPSETELAPELLSDANAISLSVQFYSSLDDFLRDQAEPIAYLTADWVRGRISLEEIQDKIEAHLGDARADEFDLEPAYEPWKPRGAPRIRQVVVEFNDLYIWRYSETDVFLFLGFRAHVAATIFCELDPRGLPWHFIREDDIGAHADFQIEISAAVRGDEIELIDVESAERV